MDNVGDSMLDKVVIGWTFNVCFDMQEKKIALNLQFSGGLLQIV